MLPFGLQTKGVVVGAVLAIFVVPFVVTKINSRGK